MTPVQTSEPNAVAGGARLSAGASPRQAHRSARRGAPAVRNSCSRLDAVLDRSVIGGYTSVGYRNRRPGCEKGAFDDCKAQRLADALAPAQPQIRRETVT